MSESSKAFDRIAEVLEGFLPDKGQLRPPRIVILEEVIKYGRALRREIELEDEVRRLGT